MSGVPSNTTIEDGHWSIAAATDLESTCSWLVSIRYVGVPSSANDHAFVTCMTIFESTANNGGTARLRASKVANGCNETSSCMELTPGVSRLYTSASGRERCPYPTVSCQGFCFHGAEEDAEIHPSTGYIPWSDAKQVCVNAEESYRGDTPDADCTGVRGKGGSCHSELPVILSCPYRDDNSISYISGIEERVSPLSVVPCEQYLHYLCSCVPDTASMISGISTVVLVVSPVVEP